MTLEVRGLGVDVAGKTLLRDVSFTLAEGDWLTIVGPNGAGKSTLLHALLGWRTASRGSVHIDGRPLGSLAGPDRARQLGWLPQRGAPAEPLPVIELVAAARYRFSEGTSARQVAARAALATVDAAALADRRTSELSGGEAQRVALASLVAQEAHTWLLDEPANHLDPAVQERVHAFLATQWRAGRTLVSVTHDLNRIFAAVGADAARVTVLGLSGGSPAFSCPLADPALTEHLSALYGVRAHRVDLEGGTRLLLEGPP